MGRTHDTDADGRPLDLIGQPITDRIAPEVGVRVVVLQEGSAMTKAEQTGEYVLDGNYFVIKAGDPVPDGAEIVGEPVEERAKPAAPENKSKQSAPENRAVKKAD